MVVAVVAFTSARHSAMMSVSPISVLGECSVVSPGVDPLVGVAVACGVVFVVVGGWFAAMVLVGVVFL